MNDNLKEALYYKKLLQNKVQCQLCPWNCIIENKKVGKCGVRLNQDGKLYSIVYERPTGLHIDPIEKKPLYHFLPGTKVLSFGTIGCNLFCKHCQNFETVRMVSSNINLFKKVTATEIVKLAKETGCKSIAYTYNEPTIFFEFMLEVAKLAKKNNIKNVIVSNGYIKNEPLVELCKYIDAANIDLKSYNEDFYRKICGVPNLKQIMQNLITLKKNGVWLEITNLIIPKLNDSSGEIEKIAIWIKDNLGKETPLHISRFHPDYLLTDIEATPVSTLKNAYNIAKKHLDNVYLGNLPLFDESSTYCPKCKTKVIEREYMTTNKVLLLGNKCPECNTIIAGIFQ